MLLRDLGTRVLEDYVGGCERAAWYKLNNQPETNPRKDRLVRAENLSEPIRNMYVDNIRKAVHVDMAPLSWAIQIPGSPEAVVLDVDVIARDRDANGDPYGIIIHIGGGIAFRNEVFGTKYSAAHPKDQDIIQAEMAMAVCPMQLTRIELLYIDRGMMDDITHVVRRRIVTADTVHRFLETVGGKDLPSASYEKDWSSQEKVARLYADKKITKEKYETFKTSHVGGDWQCTYCTFRDKCYNDDRSFR